MNKDLFACFYKKLFKIGKDYKENEKPQVYEVKEEKHIDLKEEQIDSKEEQIDSKEEQIDLV